MNCLGFVDWLLLSEWRVRWGFGGQSCVGSAWARRERIRRSRGGQKGSTVRERSFGQVERGSRLGWEWIVNLIDWMRTKFAPDLKLLRVQRSV